MKKIVVVIALMASVLVAAPAQAAQTKFLGGPLTNLDASGATVRIALTDVPTKGGLYIQQCVEAAAGVRPTLCNAPVQLWISTAMGASFAPTASISFKPTATYTSGSTNVDCTVSKCGITMRFDHTVPGDFSEDQFFALTFKTGGAPTTALAADVVSGTINGVAVTTRAPYTMAYRQSAMLAATSKAGAALTYASLAPACSLKGMEIVALTGKGECAISVTSAGNATAAASNLIMPIRLTLGVQSVTTFKAPKSVKGGSRVSLPKTTNFGEQISYTTTGSCSVSGTRVTVRKGSCEVIGTAAAKLDSYDALLVSYKIKGK
jgi:hypothetical protein